jgi:intron-binding protein aquarius
MVTRRYLATLLDSAHLVPRCELSCLRRRAEGHLFDQLLDMLKFYTTFEINDFTGAELSDAEMVELHYGFVTSMQVCG